MPNNDSYIADDRAFVDSLALKPFDTWTGQEKMRLHNIATLATQKRPDGPVGQVTWQAIDGEEIKTYVCSVEQAGKLLSMVHRRLSYIGEAEQFATRSGS